ncbi:LysR family transcriptional regulator [Shewanella avicenniae]|uniref:LysR family transcriptional regulator n=1 Tax=Shewanella avicenniae TaxID=2814294 RepID=A0ABX7QQN2_9GAMM|nr:LysR family transcriptional regulator [Shewanella avicenniae]QSX33589.1 LysR family transcriptional regulator [Shewanella avicenniae]
MDATHLYRMLVFANVVEQGSLTGAAQQLDISRSMVSQHLKNLETTLEQQLLERTTRSLALTQAGRDFYYHCAELTQMAKQAQQAVMPADDQLYGNIRLALPEAWATAKFMPLIGAFHRQYPKLQLTLTLEQHNGAAQDLQPDVRIIIAENPVAEAALPLGQVQPVLVASAEYLAAHGKPLHPDSLPQFHWLAANASQLPSSWQLTDSTGQQYRLRLTPFASCNSVVALKSLTEQGLGIACLPDYLCTEELATGRLVAVLPSYHLAARQLYAMHRFGENTPQRIGVLLKFLQENFAQ